LSGYKNPYTIPTRTCPTAALKIAQVALEEIGGQIYLFTASNPTLGYGRVPKIRETMSIYGTDSELFLYGALEKLEDISTDANEKRIFNEYISLANSCIESQISINILVTADTLDEFRDIGLFSHPCELTGGRLFYLTGSLLIEDNILRLQSQLMSSIQTVTAYEAVLKVRTSVGLKVTDLIGPGSYIKVDDELRAATLDQTTTFACALQHTSSIKDEEKFYFQVAVLYTSPDKHRRIRIHNLCLIGTSFPAVLFKHADLDGTVAFFTKSSVHKALYERYSSPDENGPRAWLTTGLVDVLYKYRHSCSESSPRTQLILPESLKLLPLYTLGLMKHPALIENKSSSIPKKGANTAGNDKPAIDTRGPSATFVVNARAHERAFEIRRLRSASVKEVINSLYPRLFALHAVADDETIEVPPAEQSQELDLQNIPRLPSLCSEYFDLNGLYLLSDQSAIYLYIGRSVPSDDIYQWFGIDIAHIHHRPKQISFSRDSHTARRMQGVVDIIRHHSTHKQGNHSKLNFNFFLILCYDRNSSGMGR
jgi:protein transport protein SEC24